jgi:hypothetical protein
MGMLYIPFMIDTLLHIYPSRGRSKKRVFSF